MKVHREKVIHSIKGIKSIFYPDVIIHNIKHMLQQLKKCNFTLEASSLPQLPSPLATSQFVPSAPSGEWHRQPSWVDG